MKVKQLELRCSSPTGLARHPRPARGPELWMRPSAGSHLSIRRYDATSEQWVVIIIRLWRGMRFLCITTERNADPIDQTSLSSINVACLQ